MEKTTLLLPHKKPEWFHLLSGTNHQVPTKIRGNAQHMDFQLSTAKASKASDSVSAETADEKPSRWHANLMRVAQIKNIDHGSIDPSHAVVAMKTGLNMFKWRYQWIRIPLTSWLYIIPEAQLFVHLNPKHTGRKNGSSTRHLDMRFGQFVATVTAIEPMKEWETIGEYKVVPSSFKLVYNHH